MHEHALPYGRLLPSSWERILLMRARWLLVVFVLVFAPSAFTQKRNITEKDLFSFNWIADPQVAPDGARVAFVKVTVNDKKDGYNTSIWLVSTGDGATKQ